ncbi:glucan biosynthesis protein G [Rhodobacteraceae bacterium RKSG542]|uniref:glucan biosynthesis protein n=1 Tax=Pseudovibrio flavus TaxID=2529854 RepID=UPI0012BBDD4F|nr:glucan biosynthesis protein G [Pseudovibrio flavus]MTI16347.1 glucan biosynthesis protein G [Pseudovibrio flavus]
MHLKNHRSLRLNRLLVAAGLTIASTLQAAAFDLDDVTARLLSSAQEGGDAAISAVFPEGLNYDGYRTIHFRSDAARWKDAAPYELQAFHLGWLYEQPVELFEVDDDTVSPLKFTTQDFTYGDDVVLGEGSDETVFDPAGFRLHYPLNTDDYKDELIAFLGASYFRVLGRGSVYGLSARGLSVNTATGETEEFPAFTRFYLAKPQKGDTSFRVWAELRSQSVLGAYAFTITPGAQTRVEVDARLFAQDDIEQLGIAPLTSMYLFGENDHAGFDDFRPEVHDSDGLRIVTASGEEVWRPLSNPQSLQHSFIAVSNMASFSLEQRDRNPLSYLDANVSYERRPSVRVVPESNWGEGHVVLMEIPTDQEIHDNIAAFWTPSEPVKKGQMLNFRYSLYWGSEVSEPVLAPVLQTRTGKAGHAVELADPLKRKFAIDFKGDEAFQLFYASEVEPQVSLANGTLENVYAEEISSGHWRAYLDVEREAEGVPVEMRLKLLEGETPVTETWIYQWGRP